MPKQPTGVGLAEKKALEVAEELGYGLVDVELAKEATGRFLRFYIDKEGGVSLNDCEAFHRRIQKLVDAIDFDFMEVSSPGVDRPLKKDRDFEAARGERVEVRLYRPINGAKCFVGTLKGLADGRVEIVDAQGEELSFERKQVALVKKVFDFDERMLDALDEEEQEP